ncbi:transposase [Streptomyces camponoticapitis]|uniref:transposase n=1 Tax=Streptomyces camponoticapitis TaxID=1616125 RepID=UPI00227D6534|nr:transposase [Streptomyces camponoticapitis]
MPRHARLTDQQRDLIHPLSPSGAGRRGRTWADHRRIAEAFAYRYRTGIPWRNLPTASGQGRPLALVVTPGQGPVPR